jgi:superfamily II DNA or RNA helicase
MYASELEMRLSDCMARATKVEYAHLLPPLTTQTLRVDVPKSFDPRELVEQFMRMDAHKVDTEAFVRQHSNHKIGTVAELAVEAATGSSRVAVMCYLHKTAHNIGAEIERLGGKAEVFTGETVAKKRMESIATCAATGGNRVAVITMSSVRESVDLTAFSTIYFAELFPSPGLISQVCGRFHRLSSKLPVFLYFVIVNGSYEELVASRLTARLNDTARLYTPGMSEDGIIDAFEDKRSDEAFRDHLSALMESAPEQI